MLTFMSLLAITFVDPYCRNDETRQPLSRKVPIPSSRINPYRMVIVLRLVVLCIFLRYRITHPVNNAYPLWLLSVICEIWFALSWILDQFPKWSPINRETYLDRLALRWCEVFTANSKLSLISKHTKVQTTINTTNTDKGGNINYWYIWSWLKVYTSICELTVRHLPCYNQ